MGSARRAPLCAARVGGGRGQGERGEGEQQGRHAQRLAQGGASEGRTVGFRSTLETEGR
ncbi:hypothetical protein ACIOHO_10285 [Streptomyces sp. NPDC087849]|uniref:hypothetical protein n=1 Tax=unclassified Streptomyces TaxID=2593676 RepID=UPI0037F234E7